MDRWGKLHDGGHRNLFLVPHILRVRNWRGCRWKNMIKISVEKTGTFSGFDIRRTVYRDIFL